MEKYLKLMNMKFTLNAKNVIKLVETNDEGKILNDIGKILNEIGKILNDIEKIVKGEEIFNLKFRITCENLGCTYGATFLNHRLQLTQNKMTHYNTNIY